LTPDAAKAAAGLLVLYPVDDLVCFLLTKRGSHLPQHGGQVSLPGGAVDPGESIEEAALREAEEEVALGRSRVAVVGRLTPVHIPVSGFVLYPVVGMLHDRPSVRPVTEEVDRILEVSVGDLIDPARRRHTVLRRDGVEMEVPYFDLDGEQVWGATAMVLAEFATLLAPPDS
jgi:8-oxo-dGTP pyrophosphatase MutT (NUDIX family)